MTPKIKKEKSSKKFANKPEVVMGASYNAPNNSQHTFHGVTSFNKTAERFDPHLDRREARKPAPNTYKPKDKLCHNKLLAHVPAYAPRFDKHEYMTEPPGPGAYRV